MSMAQRLRQALAGASLMMTALPVLALGLSPGLSTPPAVGAPSKAPPVLASASEPLTLPPLAEGPRAVDALTVARALQLVWAENPQVREAEKAIEAAGFEVRGSYGGFLPSVTVLNGTGRNALSSVQASLPLWNGGLTVAQIDGSKAREVIARATLDKVRLTLANQTLTAFYNLAQAEAQQRQWGSYRVALDRLQQSISNRASQGVATQSEVQTAVSRIQQAEVGREAARLQALTSQAELAKLLNVSPQSVQWSDQLDGLLRELVSVDMATLVDRNPEVMIAAAQVAEQTALSRQAKAKLYPEVAVQYRHYYDGQAFDNTADSPQLVVQYQVGNGYSAYQGARAAESKVESAKAHLETARREAQATLAATRQQLASSTRQLALQKAASTATQALVDSFLRQYQVGRRSWIEVLNAQREAHDNELAYIASRKAYALTAQQLIVQMLAWEALLRQGEASPAATP